MKQKQILAIFIFVLALVICPIANAQIPEVISYQGILTDSSGAPLTGNYDITVKIYDVDTGGTALWTETHSGVAVSKGVFSVMLGSANAFPADLDFSVPYWLGVSINAGSELTPRTQLASVGTAFMAKKVIELPAGMVSAFAMPTAPTGWFACNGQAVSRLTYADLFAAIGTMYGAGDGATTFNVPDYRGYFLRAWDNARGIDPDRDNRTPRPDGTAGDNVGTQQADELETHYHQTRNDGPATNGGSGGKGIADSYSFNTATSNAGGNETRPKNINVLYCIKY